MADPKKALATQLANIEKRTGKSLNELSKIVESSGLSKHGEIVAMLKNTLGMGHGDANTLAHTVRNPDAQSAETETASPEQVLDRLYSGKKDALRPIHEELQKELAKLGSFEQAPKKTYISYRRKKQFAMIGPATNTRVEVGLNLQGLPATERLEELPPGKMCAYRVRLSDASQVDKELMAWIKKAYEAAS